MAKRKLKKAPVLGLVCALVVVIGLAVLLRLVPGVSNLSEPVTVTVSQGQGARSVAAMLADAGVVKNKLSFELFVKREGAEGDLRPGTYTFSGEVSFDDVLAELKRGNLAENTLNVTVPEGKTVPQVAEIWANAGLCTVDEFLAACAEVELDYDFLPTEVVGEKYNRVEGFLFPETYNVRDDWGAEQLVKLQVGQFAKLWTEERSSKASDMGYTAAEIVTVASLIEREARVADERPLVASVIYNRLDIGQLLQIDATIQYILGEQVDRVLYRHLEIDDPYNTYMYAGLPPGAICSPGISCIDAALAPAETDYYYYRTKNDGSGEHNFARTLAEHNANANK